MSLTSKGITLRIDGHMIVDSAEFTVPANSLVALVGPNGAGKSSLLRLISGTQNAGGGEVDFNGNSLLSMPRRLRAQHVALVEQDAYAEFALMVRQAVELGRIPFQSIWAGLRDGDREIVEDALERTGSAEFADRSIATLSGGEQQRVHLARALAQQPQLLLLDEPTNHLDIRAQLRTLRLLHSLTDLGVTVVAALHDLNLAAAYCDHVVVMKDGKIRAVGPVEEIIRPELIADIYGVAANVVAHPRTGRPLIAFSESI